MTKNISSIKRWLDGRKLEVNPVYVHHFDDRWFTTRWGGSYEEVQHEVRFFAFDFVPTLLFDCEQKKRENIPINGLTSGVVIGFFDYDLLVR